MFCFLNSNLGYGNKNEVNDCNLALENNKVYTAKSNALHRPTSDSIWYSIICISYGQSDLKQIAVPVNSSVIVHFRSCNSGTWSEWSNLITNSDLFVIKGNYTITSGYVIVTDSRIKANTGIFISNIYNVAGSVKPYTFTVQLQAGKANIYIRKGDGSLPPDNETIELYLLVSNNI